MAMGARIRTLIISTYFAVSKPAPNQLKDHLKNLDLKLNENKRSLK